MENESELDQIGQEIQPYMYEPNPGDDVESDGSYPVQVRVGMMSTKNSSRQTLGD